MHVLVLFPSWLADESNFVTTISPYTYHQNQLNSFPTSYSNPDNTGATPLIELVIAPKNLDVNK